MSINTMTRTATILALAGMTASQSVSAQPLGGPPPEAFAACLGQGAGTACSHPTPFGSVEGTCQPRGERMQCIPARGPGGGGPGRGGPQLDAHCNEIDRAPGPPVTFATLPVPHQRSAPASFTLPDGRTHWYETVHLPQGGVNWVQAKALAEQAGGYLATLHSRAENDFVFDLIADRKFWFAWDGSHNHVMNGPFLGGCQPAGSSEPRGGWRWVTGEPWSYENWAWDGMPGDRDPRPSGQPNDATGNQNVTAFGEVNEPVATWGDFPHKFSSFQSQHDGKALGFVIEYDAPPR